MASQEVNMQELSTCAVNAVIDAVIDAVLAVIDAATVVTNAVHAVGSGHALQVCMLPSLLTGESVYV